jgi:hypothetical protein
MDLPTDFDMLKIFNGIAEIGIGHQGSIKVGNSITTSILPAIYSEDKLSSGVKNRVKSTWCRNIFRLFNN